MARCNGVKPCIFVVGSGQGRQADYLRSYPMRRIVLLSDSVYGSVPNDRRRPDHVDWWSTKAISARSVRTAWNNSYLCSLSSDRLAHCGASCSPRIVETDVMPFPALWLSSLSPSSSSSAVMSSSLFFPFLSTSRASSTVSEA